MDAIDRYIQRLSDPRMLVEWDKIYHRDEEEPAPDEYILTGENVATAEEALGFPLPPSYRKLVLTTQPDEGPNHMVLWVWDGERFGIDMVWVKENDDKPLPPFLINVIDHENGNADCFDTRHPDERGEYPIVHFDHEIHDEDSTKFETVAKDLGEYLLGSLGKETSSSDEDNRDSGGLG